MKKEVKDVFKVVVMEGDDEATMLLYGRIGYQMYYDEPHREDLTDIAFIQQLSELERKYKRINIRINSPGGSMFHGMSMCTAIRKSTSEIHTYVDGVAASMAADIFLCGKYRHMPKGSLLMIHSSINIAMGNAKELRKTADMLDQFTETMIQATAGSTGKSEDEIRTAFYDYEDHWLTAQNALDFGLIKEIEGYEIANPIEGAQKMSFKDLVKAFGESHIDKVTDEPVTDFPIIENTDMTIEEIKKALADGTLSAEELQAALPPVAAPAVVEKSVTPEVDKVDQLLKTVETLEQKLNDLMKESGSTGPTTGGLPNDPIDNKPDVFKESIAEMAKVAQDYRNPFSGNRL